MLRFLLPDGTIPVVVYFVSPPSLRPSSRYFPFEASPGGDIRCLSVGGACHQNTRYCILVICPAHEHGRLLTCSITYVIFSYPNVSFPVPVSDVLHTSLDSCLCGCKISICLASECPCVGAICLCWKYS